MSKNIVIYALLFIVTILIGVLLLTNYSWFSDEWLIGLGLVVGSLGGIGLFVYLKIQK